MVEGPLQTPISRPPTQVIEPASGFRALGLAEIWQYRELLFILAWRELKVRYKQTLIGVLWAILQPLITAILFAIIFGYFIDIPSDDVPYPIFAYVALLPWTYVAQAVERSSNSLVENERLITKIYFPRMLIPMASVVTPVVDMGLALLVLVGMLIYYDIRITLNIVVLPLFIVLAFLSAFGVGLWFAAINVRYRDVRYAIPFLLQIWMYASPVVYSQSVFPESLRLVISLNPLSSVIGGFRWALVGTDFPDIRSLGLSCLVVFVTLAGGLIYFKRMEDSFADII